MQSGRIAYNGNILIRNLIFVCFLQQASHKQLCQSSDMQHMKAALSITELNNVGEDLNHQFIASLLLQNLLCHHMLQLFLLCKKNQSIDNAPADRAFVKWSADIILNAQIIRSVHICRNRFCRNHNYRNALNPSVLIHNCQRLKSIHHRHHNIQKHQSNLLLLIMKNPRCFHSMFRF